MDVEQLNWRFHVNPDDAPRISRKGGVGPTWAAPPRQKTRNAGGRHGNKAGYGLFIIGGVRQQRCIAPVRIAQGSGASWYKHGAYLQRDGGQREGRGVGFDAQQEKVALAQTIGQWQKEGDPHLFQMILSPDHAEDLNLTDFTRKVMKAIERDLGKPLEWIAIDHHNTKHIHIHVSLRGVSRDREELWIAKDYLWGGVESGIHKRAGEVLTQEIGWKLAPELAQIAQRAVERERFGQHDRSLFWKLDKDDRVQDRDVTVWERKRLHHLQERELAWEQGGVWELAYRWKEKLEMQEREERGRKPKEQEREEQDRKREPEQERSPEADAAEKRKRLVRVIDDRERGR